MEEKTNFTLIIAQIIEYLGVSRNDFAKTLGYKRSQSIYDIASGKSRPSFDFFERFFKSDYKNIFNPVWMFTGEGEMLKQAYLTEDDVISNVKESDEIYFKALPYVSEENRQFLVKNINNKSFLKVLPVFEIPNLKEDNTVVFEDPKVFMDCAPKGYLVAQEYDVNTPFVLSGIYIMAIKQRLLFAQIMEHNKEENYYTGKNEKEEDVRIEIASIKKAWKTIMIISATEPL